MKLLRKAKISTFHLGEAVVHCAHICQLHVTSRVTELTSYKTYNSSCSTLFFIYSSFSVVRKKMTIHFF